MTRQDRVRLASAQARWPSAACSPPPTWCRCWPSAGCCLSREQVYRLVTRTPERLSLATLAALCDILGCQPGRSGRAGRARPTAAGPAVTPGRGRRDRPGRGGPGSCPVLARRVTAMRADGTCPAAAPAGARPAALPGAAAGTPSWPGRGGRPSLTRWPGRRGASTRWPVTGAALRSLAAALAWRGRRTCSPAVRRRQSAGWSPS